MSMGLEGKAEEEAEGAVRGTSVYLMEVRMPCLNFSM